MWFPFDTVFVIHMAVPQGGGYAGSMTYCLNAFRLKDISSKDAFRLKDISSKDILPIHNSSKGRFVEYDILSKFRLKLSKFVKILTKNKKKMMGNLQ